MLDVRTWLAGMAMNGILTESRSNRYGSLDFVVNNATSLADALLIKLNGEGEYISPEVARRVTMGLRELAYWDSDKKCWDPDKELGADFIGAVCELLSENGLTPRE